MSAVNPGRVLWLLYVGSAVLLACAFGLALHDLAHSNRPHELDKTPLVVAVLSLNLAACLALVVRGRAALRARTGQGQAVHLKAAAFVVLAHVGFSVIVWLIAVNTLIMWLGAGG